MWAIASLILTSQQQRVLDMKNRFLNVTAPPAGAPKGLSEWFYSLQATLNDFIMINERSGPANVTVDGNRTSLLNFVDPNGCLTVTPDEQTVTLDFSGLTPIVPVPPACPNCANPPRTVTVVVTGATDPNCDGAYDCEWTGSSEICTWSVSVGDGFMGVYWQTDHWRVDPTWSACSCAWFNISAADCNTGASSAGCGGTVTVTPNP